MIINFLSTTIVIYGLRLLWRKTVYSLYVATASFFLEIWKWPPYIHPYSHHTPLHPSNTSVLRRFSLFHSSITLTLNVKAYNQYRLACWDVILSYFSRQLWTGENTHRPPTMRLILFRMTRCQPEWPHRSVSESLPVPHKEQYHNTWRILTARQQCD